jgi:hypothetical protein
MLKPFATMVSHVLWFLACLPGWLLFLVALRHPRRTQERVLRRLIRQNRDTVFGRRHDFHAIHGAKDFEAPVPLAEYEDFADAINAVERGTF